MFQAQKLRSAVGVMTCLLLLIGTIPAAMASLADGSATNPSLPRDSSIGPVDARTKAKAYCGTCHIFPEPELLDKKTWSEKTLRRMKIRMGLSPQDIENHPESKLLKATGVFPTSPIISIEDWDSIVEYYLQNAPELPLPQDPRPEIKMGLKHFTVERPAYRRPLPSSTLVKINETRHQIYLGDGEAQTLDVLENNGNLLETINIANIPVSLSETSRGIYVTAIGHFQPSEDPQAELIYLERRGAGFNQPKSILKKLPRTTHSDLVDLNGDGKVDCLMCIYGNNVGRLAWFENLGRGQFEEHVLIAKSGAIRTEVHDLNGDGFPDIAVLMAQESESFFILMNDGKGNFKQQIVFQKHPLMGHTYFEMADFNKDGKLDFIVTNGDNGEYASPLKKYHGIRIYLNRGEAGFEESFFYPLNGAFKAMARDFDQDGDLDIVAISFFPDYSKFPEESFVYLENQGNLKFTASTFRECSMGRWLTMDVGDLDGDGDIDIVLGSYIRGPSPVPAALAKDWESTGPSIAILRNHLLDPK
jgi:hypothetical protein